MNRKIIAALPFTLVFSLLGTLAAAPPVAPVPHKKVELAPAPRAKVTAPIADVVEVIVYTPVRPVRARVHVESSGKLLSDVWVAAMRQAFDYFDRDRDGFLNKDEVENIFSDTGLSILLMNGLYQPTPQDRPKLEKLDRDGDGKVSFAEFVGYYTVSSALALRTAAPQADNPGSASTTEALFSLFDTNKDGKLTRDELLAAEKLIPLLDSDEDECLSLNELLTSPSRGGRFRPVQAPPAMRTTTGPSPESQLVAVFMPGRIPGTVIQHIIKKYDKDGDFKLNREESGFDEATFKRLDKNGDGKLDSDELDAWRLGPPDFEVKLSNAPKSEDGVATLLTAPKVLGARGFKSNQVGSRKLVVRAGRHPIEFWATTSAGSQFRLQPSKMQLGYLFDQAAGKKGYVEDKDLVGPMAVQYQLLRTLFDAADANGDGKLTKDEFNTFFDMQDAFRAVSLTVSPAVQTPTLFQLLDENRDGRLSVRELRSAWDRLIELEPPGSDSITKAAIQPTISIRLQQSAERFNSGVQFEVEFDSQNQGQVAVPQKGPLWFRRMDRNGDGDVSRSEFLGTREEFDRIDTNRDGLISLEEAEAYDKLSRRGEEKKPMDKK